MLLHNIPGCHLDFPYRFKRSKKQILDDPEGPEVDIKIKPHGNSKGDRPFFRTAASTRKRIKQLASSSTSKAVVSQLTREKGGEIEA